MKGVTKYFPSGVIEVEALKAGADIFADERKCSQIN